MAGRRQRAAVRPRRPAGSTRRSILFGTDGTNSPSQFKIPGTYISNFGPDISTSTSPMDKSLVAGVAKYGPYGAFGVPTYAATDVVMQAIGSVCKAGQTPSRSNVLAAIKKTDIPASENMLGVPIAFTSTGNLRAARVTCSTSTARARTSRSRPSNGSRQAATRHGQARGAAHVRVGGAAGLIFAREQTREGILPDLRQRPHRGLSLRADRARLHDGLRRAEAAQLRARRRVHGRGVHRLLRHPVVRRRARALDPGAAAPVLHVCARVDRLRVSRRRDGALRLPAAAKRAQNRAADHRAGDLVRARELGPAAVRRLHPQLQHQRLHPVLDRRSTSAASGSTSSRS